MKIAKLTKTYNLIGSLLEAVHVDESTKTITIELDFCYWQQKEFVDGDIETGMVALVFSDCTEYHISEHQINSDEIVNIEVADNNSIDMCVESDLTGEYHHIRITAMNVEFVNL